MNELVDLPADGRDRMLPPESDAGAGFWAATRDRRLVLQWCGPCERAIHYPREACPHCLGTELAFRDAAGTGTVYARTEIPKPWNPTMVGRTPYVVALVELPEGVRLLTNVVGPGAEGAAIGDAVEVAWEPLSDGRHLPVFVLADP